MVLHAIPLSWSIDEHTGVRDPRGMFGRSLAVDVHVVSAARPLNAAEATEIRMQLPEEFQLNYDPYGSADVALDSAEHLLAERDVTVHRHSTSGDPASAILDLADDVDADLIVVGSRGHGRTLRFLRGSVSTKVMHHADRNVLIVHD